MCMGSGEFQQGINNKSDGSKKAEGYKMRAKALPWLRNEGGKSRRDGKDRKGSRQKMEGDE